MAVELLEVGRWASHPMRNRKEEHSHGLTRSQVSQRDTVHRYLRNRNIASSLHQWALSMIREIKICDERFLFEI